MKQAASRGVKIRVLVQMDNKIRTEMAKHLQHLGIDVRDNKKPLQTKVTTFILDNALSLIVELKDDSKETSEEESIGLATYSNSQLTVFSYISKFENLWVQRELHMRER